MSELEPIRGRFLRRRGANDRRPRQAHLVALASMYKDKVYQVTTHWVETPGDACRLKMHDTQLWMSRKTAIEFGAAISNRRAELPSGVVAVIKDEDQLTEYNE